MACWRLLRLLIVLASGLLIASQGAAGLDPAKAITQYAHESWHTGDGLPQDNILSIAQTPDGYLWLGTEEGLARFDGIRFTVFDKSNTPELESSLISALLVDQMGNLWIGTDGGGVLRMTEGKLVAFTTQNGLSSNSVLSLGEDKEHGIWIGTEGGGVNRFKDGKFTIYNSKIGLADDAVYSICATQDGSVWFGTGGGLSQLKDGSLRNFTAQQGLPNKNVRAVFEDREGTLWVGTNGGGLGQFRDGKFKTFTTRDGLASNSVFSIYQDKEGSLWIGTFGGGLNRWSNGQFKAYNMAAGLTSDNVLVLFQDREGSLWIGTVGGLNQLRDSQVTPYSAVEGLSSDIALPIYEDREGSLWIGTAGKGLNRLRNDQLTAYTTKQGLSDNFVLSLSEDQAGALWVGTKHGLDRMKDGKFTVYTRKDGLPNDIVLSLWPDRDGGLWLGTRSGLGRFKDGKFTTYTTKDGLSVNYVTFIYQDREGTVWVGTGGGGLDRFKDGKFTAFTSKDGLSNDNVLAIHDDEEGTLWVGTSGGGLNRFRDGRFTTIAMKDGLYDDKIFQILEDSHHNFWMSSNRGIFRVSKQQLKDFLDGKIKSIQSVSYGTSEGMKSQECNGAFQPAGWKTKDGRLWFPTMKGAVVIDPSNSKARALPPQVRIEQVFVDNYSFEPGEAIRVARGAGKLEFQYTGISLLAPKRVHFKYRLEGFDSEWVEAGTRRMAYYANIRPGQYQFRVKGSTDDEVWSEASDPVHLVLEPPFYQTFWFYFLCAMALGGAFGLVRLRIAQMKARARQLAALVQERTMEVQRSLEELRALAARLQSIREEERKRVAREIHDELGQALTAIKLDLYSLLRHMPADQEERSKKTSSMLKLVDETIRSVRRISTELRPGMLDDLGLVATVEWAAGEFETRSGTKCQLDLPREHITIDPETATAVFRIFQETLTNVARHADASEVKVRLAKDDRELTLEVHDNGKGIAESKLSSHGSLGILGMRERAILLGGDLTISGAPGKGTTVRIRIPEAHCAKRGQSYDQSSDRRRSRHLTQRPDRDPDARPQGRIVWGS